MSATIRERLWTDVLQVLTRVKGGELAPSEAQRMLRDMLCATHRGHWVAELLDAAVGDVHWELLLELLIEEASADPMGAKEFVDFACDGGIERALFKHTALPAPDHNGDRWAVEVGEQEIAVFTYSDQANAWMNDNYPERASLRRVPAPRGITVGEALNEHGAAVVEALKLARESVLMDGVPDGD